MTILYDNCKKPFEGTDEQAVELGEVLCGFCGSQSFNDDVSMVVMKIE